jgi:predicted nucleotide-binding protein
MPPLTDSEREIAKTVVHRFLNLNKSSPHKSLIRQFKDPQSLERLVSAGVLNPIGNRETYLPNALAFHCCGDVDALNKAKTAATTVLHVLQNLFDVDWEKETFTPADVERHAEKMYDTPPFPETIKLGLYLVPEFRVLSTYSFGPEHTELLSLGMSDTIVTLKNIEGAWDERMGQLSRYLENDPEPIPNAYERQTTMEPNSRNVFVVHGRDNAAKETVARFLERLGLRAIILHEQPNKGATLIEKFEANSDVGFAVVLLTPDDIGGVATEPAKMAARARQNVVLELGYFIGKLGRQRVCALYMEGVEIPSDFQGVVYVPYDEGEGWRLKLATELRAAGMEVDLKLVLDGR